jgi:hypothetical protein
MRPRCSPFILFPFVLIVVLVSCKKDHTVPPPPGPKIKTEWSGDDVRTYTYNSKGNVSQIVMSLYGKYDYAYTDTGIVVSFYDTTGAFKGKTIYKLDANGRAASSYNTYAASDKVNYTYTAAGQLLSSTTVRTLPGQPTRIWASSYYYTNNNLDSVTGNYNNGSTVTHSVASRYDEYYTDKVSTFGNDNFGQAFLGVSSKNPVKAARDIGADSQGNMPQTNYSYEYDAQNNITKVLHTWGNSTFPSLFYDYY